MISLAHLQQKQKLHLYEDAADVANNAARMIIEAADAAIEKHGVFKLVVAGGTTPLATYRILKNVETDWRAWHIFFGDERCLPERDKERNSHMVYDAWLNHIDIPPRNIHSIKSELGPVIASNLYTDEISNYLPFDLTLLGMGEDGHTASLFPGHIQPRNILVAPVYDAPKPPTERVSLSHLALKQSQHIVLMITGENKQAAMKQWEQGESLPVNDFDESANIELLIDQEALGHTF